MLREVEATGESVNSIEGVEVDARLFVSVFLLNESDIVFPNVWEVVTILEWLGLFVISSEGVEAGVLVVDLDCEEETVKAMDALFDADKESVGTRVIEREKLSDDDFERSKVSECVWARDLLRVTARELVPDGVTELVAGRLTDAVIPRLFVDVGCRDAERVGGIVAVRTKFTTFIELTEFRGAQHTVEYLIESVSSP